MNWPLVVDLMVDGRFYASRRVTKIPNHGDLWPLKDGRRVEIMGMDVIGICNGALTVKVFSEERKDSHVSREQ